MEQFTNITTQDQFNRFMRQARRQEHWSDTKPEEWEAACEFAGVDYWDEPEYRVKIWHDLCRAWEEKRMYTIEDAEREIKQAIELEEGGIYSFIQDLNRGGDITSEEASELLRKYVFNGNGIPTF